MGRLDEEKIRWMMERKTRLDWRTDWYMEDSLEIVDKLEKDMHVTMNFLGRCTSSQLDLLEGEIEDLLTTFADGNEEGEFVDFLLDLGRSHPSTGLLRLVQSSIESIREVNSWKDD